MLCLLLLFLAPAEGTVVLLEDPGTVVRDLDFEDVYDTEDDSTDALPATRTYKAELPTIIKRSVDEAAVQTARHYDIREVKEALIDIMADRMIQTLTTTEIVKLKNRDVFKNRIFSGLPEVTTSDEEKVQDILHYFTAKGTLAGRYIANTGTGNELSGQDDIDINNENNELKNYLPTRVNNENGTQNVPTHSRPWIKVDVIKDNTPKINKFKNIINTGYVNLSHMTTNDEYFKAITVNQNTDIMQEYDALKTYTSINENVTDTNSGRRWLWWGGGAEPQLTMMPNGTEEPDTAIPLFDMAALLEIIANLTFDYGHNLTRRFNETFQKFQIPTCPPGNATTMPTFTPQYNLDNTTVVGKCFVCGLTIPGIPRDAYCADAFAGDFLPLVPVDPKARGQVARYRKYCRFLDVSGVKEFPEEPRSIFGRFTGGCSVRWIDLSGVYTQRTCRNRRRAHTGKHFLSKRMAKLEMALAHVDNGCIVSPMATLVPLSRGISLYARFHACVCTGSWCNGSKSNQTWIMHIILLFIWTSEAIATLHPEEIL